MDCGLFYDVFVATRQLAPISAFPGWEQRAMVVLYGNRSTSFIRIVVSPVM